MKQKALFFAFACFALAAISCKDGYKTAKMGLEYKFIVENKDSALAEMNDILLLNLQYSTLSDSIIAQNDNIKMQMKTPSHDGGSIEDAFAMMHLGDSACFLIDAENFFLYTRRMGLPKYLKVGDQLKFTIKLKKIIKIEDFKTQQKSIESENEQEEKVLLDQFIKTSNIQVAPTSTGLYYVVKKKGNGKKPTQGKRVKVNYYGYFVDGKPFDNSYERHQPFIFTFGVGEVIEGWDEGIGKMTEGGSAMLVIPSRLAYGSQKKGPIPPFTTLVFDIELLQVE